MFETPLTSVTSLTSRLKRPSARVAAGVAASLTVAALLAPAGALAAQAGSAPCGTVAASQAFLPWGDTSNYQLVAGGDFEKGSAAWTLASGAGVVAGSEPFGATGAVGKSSLDLPAGATAQSPPICVTAAYPTMRLFARGLTPGASVLVSVVYDGGLLSGQTVPVGAVTAGAAWAPSSSLSTLASVVLMGAGSAQVSLHFTELTGQSQIDDVFVDPRLTY